MYRAFVMLVICCSRMFLIEPINTIIFTNRIEFNLASNNEPPVFVDLIVKVNWLSTEVSRSHCNPSFEIYKQKYRSSPVICLLSLSVPQYVAAGI
jgi:hypothetical protein